MKRFAEEKHLMIKRLKGCVIDKYFNLGQFRKKKTLSCCDKKGCCVCNPDKYPVRTPDMRERIANIKLKEWLV